MPLCVICVHEHTYQDLWGWFHCTPAGWWPSSSTWECASAAGLCQHGGWWCRWWRCQWTPMIGMCRGTAGPVYTHTHTSIYTADNGTYTHTEVDREMCCGETNHPCMLLVLSQKAVLLWKGSHRGMRGNYSTAQAPIFSALCCFFYVSVPEAVKHLRSSLHCADI